MGNVYFAHLYHETKCSAHEYKDSLQNRTVFIEIADPVTIQ